MSLAFLISVALFIVMVSLVSARYKGITAAAAVVVTALLSSWVAVNTLLGDAYNETLYGGSVFGEIPLRLDGLSAWFVLLTNFTMITGILYGQQYLKQYQRRRVDLSMHYICYLLNHTALICIFFIQNSLAFLCSWEIMALSALVMVIFEYERMETLKAGINYLIQSHISILLLTLGFIWVYTKTGSLDFNAIRAYCMSNSSEASILLFLVFFSGFAIKAGFVPFHTWLPYAHPIAPSHVSGIMSGVIIKTGIYGILRILLLMPDNHLAIGYFILIISVISGVYGVMLAIVQHNIKKLLAYHSIENIGIIGIGIGVGVIGNALDNRLMAFAGYAGALLHTLNHSLFKSLLFFSAGTVYTATHTLIIDRLGGLIRKLPHTAILFLIAALAICGLPPFNGFISELLIYSGLFNAIGANQSASVIVLAIIGLAIMGGLALMCFTKAFGIIFLGTERHAQPEALHEASRATLFPMYLIAAFIILIGLFPQWFIAFLIKPVSLFVPDPGIVSGASLADLMQKISLSVWGLVLLTVILYLIRKLLTRRSNNTLSGTWDCGYGSESPKLQYTASSFVRSYSKLIKPVVDTKKTRNEPADIIPHGIHTETHYYDKIERNLIDWPVRNLKGFLGRFKFLQNGVVQFYVLYGVVFIGIAITIPLIIEKVQNLVQLLKQL